MTPAECEIGIIGGTGGMGKWCAALLRAQGYTVHQSGRNSGLSPEEMARRCSVVIVTVPMEVTAGVIELVGPLLGEESLLMDLTSLKEEPVRMMLAATRAEVMGCHPLFGPHADPLQDLTVVLCPGRVNKWAAWPGEIFKAADVNVIETTAEKHDRLMAVVQGINHLNTIHLALAIRDCGIDRQELERYATPLFRSKLAIADKVTTGNARMYAEIIQGNRYMAPQLERYQEILRELIELVRHGDGKIFADGIIQKRCDGESIPSKSDTTC